jgi:hypothetical protein
MAVIASEAKQSIAQQKRKLDCFVATLLAMTAEGFSSWPGSFRPSMASSKRDKNVDARDKPGHDAVLNF